MAIIVCRGGVNGCFKYSSHLFLRFFLRWRSSIFFAERWKELHSLARKECFISSYVILDVVGLTRVPYEMDPMMSSTWLSICAKFKIHTWTSIRKVRLLYWVTKKGDTWASRCWKLFYGKFSNFGQLKMIGSWRTHFDMLHASSCPSWKPSNEVFSSRLPKF